MNYYPLARIAEPPPGADKSAGRRVKPGDRKGRPYISMSYEHRQSTTVVRISSFITIIGPYGGPFLQ